MRGVYSAVTMVWKKAVLMAVTLGWQTVEMMAPRMDHPKERLKVVHWAKAEVVGLVE